VGLPDNAFRVIANQTILSGEDHVFFSWSLMNRIPSITALQCFEASARLGSFTRAAQELHLTQGAVSRQVIGLEDRVGVKLFLRKQNALALALTDAGRNYLEEVAPLLQGLERATANARAHRGSGGALNLSVGASFGSYWLIPRLSAFTRRHPEIVLNVATRVGPADFAAHRLDASLEFGDGQRPGMVCDFVLPLELQPYASPGWIRKFGAKLGEATPRTALIHHSTGIEAWAEWFRHAGISAEPRREGPVYDLMWMAMNAAANDLGAVLLPPYMSQDAVATRRLRRLSKLKWRAPKGYYLVYPQASSEHRALQTFRAWLLEQVAAPD
jgi:LysR family transcriptional regulator, glycine cleavage system transcriptional activator